MSTNKTTTTKQTTPSTSTTTKQTTASTSTTTKQTTASPKTCTKKSTTNKSTKKVSKLDNFKTKASNAFTKTKEVVSTYLKAMKGNVVLLLISFFLFPLGFLFSFINRKKKLGFCLFVCSIIGLIVYLILYNSLKVYMY